MTRDDVDIGRRIRARRLQRGFSQQRLANAIGLTFQQVQKYERATNRVAATTLVAIARALDTPLVALLPKGRACVEDEAATPSDDVDAIILACLRLDDDGRAKTLRFIETLERARA